MVAYAEDCQAAEMLIKSAEENEAEGVKEVPIKYRDDVDACVHKMDECDVSDILLFKMLRFMIY